MTVKPIDMGRKTLESIIETAIDGILTINTRGIVLSMNSAACELFEYSREEVLGENIRILMPEPDRSQHDQYLANYMNNGIPKIIGIGREVIGRKKDGVLFPCRLAVSEVKMDDDRIFVGIIHDLSEVRKAQEEILELNKNLEEKVRNRTNDLQKAVNTLLSLNKDLESEIRTREKIQEELRQRERQLNDLLQREKELGALKSRFVAMASHEFRTPLTTIKSSASLISKYVEEIYQEKRQMHVDRIRKSVTHLNSILNDFLSMSVLEEGKLVMKPEDHDLLGLCREVIEELKASFKDNRDIHLRSIGDSRLVFLDKSVFKNIVMNLLTNALKYSEEEIQVQLEFEEECIKLSVEDKGIGIPLEDQKHLLSRFFRASNAMNIKGTGLGLNIVKTYLDYLGGEISFHSVEQQGSTFYVVIPTSNEK